MSNILVTRSSMPPMQEYIDEITAIWDSHWLTNMGEKHKLLQSELKKMLEADNVELFTNGHMALELTIQAFGFKEGSEVITTPYTFISTTHAIVRNRLKPVFCDINPNNYTIDVEKIEDLITDKTVAILPVHVYGNICDVEKIQQIADKHGLKVIYDAAHSFGEKYKEKSVAEFGDVSCFSFHATKVFNTIEGGAACYSDTALGTKLYQLKNFGIVDEETINGIGANAKMNEFCAAMGICNLRHFDEEIAKREVVYNRYIENLEGIQGIKTNRSQENVKYNYAYFPIIIEPSIYGKTRDDLHDLLLNNGIGSRRYFYPISNACDCYSKEYDANDTPIALDISKKVLTLPMYADLTNDIVDKICSIIKGQVIKE
ncbi:DegT/DnrJ/EryC1/StrS family aminotransferase [Butyrivibrio sp. XBB1001]|uniref:DegT/DnrJ/EryC1/StrS family aminotransferase n=1 Tax=Butyrivibrio sp. XBB1001 TaxID=1280682 RepID=UPI00041576D1|nr:DegT/DnrJ/EryC1/StrS family aminotransferase [Butyrivibrio sp. XBB1001]